MELFKGRRILVTGGAGFIGSHLVEALVDLGGIISIVDDISTGYERNLTSVVDHIEFIRFDLRSDNIPDLLSAGRYEIIFHLAASAYVPPSVENPRLDFEMNAVATLNLLEALRTADLKSKLVFTSTAAVYGEGFGEPLKETDPTFPVSPYAVSKLAAERYVAVYASLFGLPTAIVRLFSVYGPRLRKQVVYDLMCKIHENPHRIKLFGDGSQERDFNHVRNMVDGILCVATHAPYGGEVYNVAGNQAISIDEVAQLICQHMMAEPEFAYTGNVRPGDTQRWTADIARIASLGYKPKIALKDGLADTVAWFKQEQVERYGK